MEVSNEIKTFDFSASPLLKTLLPSYRKIIGLYEDCVTEYNQVLTDRNEVKKLLSDFASKTSSLEKSIVQKDLTLKDVNQRLSDSTSKANTLEDSIVQKDLTLKEVEEKYNNLIIQLQKIEKEKMYLSQQFEEINARYQLVVTALSAKLQESDRYNNYRKLLHERFLPFTNSISVLKNEAEVVLKLRAIEDQLRLIESLYHFKNKSVVAVSGGFSSGKSSFISSLFTDADIQLPIGVEPITAIPTYVCHSSSRKIAGYNDKGGIVDIPPELYSQLSHKFVEGFGFNLKELLPFIALETPMEKYQDISFIDLPGYNPGDRGGITDADENTASEFMQQAGAIFWVIGLDANGTISRADIDFIYDNVPEKTKLYIVLNKADLKPYSDVEIIIESVAEMLDMDDISYEGISAYSSEMQEEIAFEKKSLFEILSEWNTPIDSFENIKVEIDTIFSDYEDAFFKVIKENKDNFATIRALELDLHELGAFEIDQSDAFDIEKYRTRPKVKKTKTGTIGINRSLMNMLGQSIQEKNIEDEEINPKEIKPSLKHKGSTEYELKLDKINSIRKCLTDIKVNFNVSEKEAQLDVLMTIGDEFMSIFSSNQTSKS